MEFKCKKEVVLGKQEGITMCWAAIVDALLRFHDRDSPGQDGLKNLHGEGQNKPQEILVGRGFTKIELGEYPHRPNQIELDQRRKDVGFNLMYELEKGPVLASLTTADDATWAKSTGGVYRFHHAILITSYKEYGSNGVAAVTYIDPAKPVDSNRRELDVADLVGGFVYADSLGPRARTFLVDDPGAVRARLRMLIALKPPR